MKGGNSLADPFVLTALAVLGVCSYAFYALFLERNFITFTTEEEVSETIEQEFPLFIEYL